VFKTEFVDDFRHDFVHHAVGASGAVVHGVVQQQLRAAVDLVFGFYDVFAGHGVVQFLASGK
jgi:hypothetical protein